MLRSISYYIGRLRQGGAKNEKKTLTLFLSTGIPVLSNAEVGISTHSINSVRTSFSVRIQKLQDLDSNEISVYPSLQTLLDLYGAKIDLQSKIKIH